MAFTQTIARTVNVAAFLTYGVVVTGGEICVLGICIADGEKGEDGCCGCELHDEGMDLLLWKN